ncbi:acyltransferase family protein [Micrococcoides hystricis]|uniref:Acyltransferase family protein n=1 Tax=Micrococcoides hystricis TaxID=1572761 RepID=A0ABV6PC30_9MICC
MPTITPIKPQKDIGAGFRPEIQGLRAIAIAVVLLFHLWPNRITGGFVGVDVFFVISGYLITGHLFKELLQTGKIRLGRFWSRRIRRLLPLSFTVLIFSFITMLLLMPGTTWSTNIRHIVASTLYVENWALAFDAVDYLAQTDEGNMVTHYWSLSIEEQFYVFLPLILLAAVFLATMRAKHNTVNYRTVALTVLTIVGVVSLAISVIFTAQNQAEAYFVTPTRMWEFVVGGVIALLGVQIHGKLGNTLGWLGVTMILAAAFLFDGNSPFPGYIALLPVLGAGLLLCCGSDKPGTGVYWWASTKPAQWLGDWSYAVYLWHWPLIVLAQYRLDEFLWHHKVVVLVLSLLLGWASKHLIEDPARFAPKLQGTKPSLAMMLAGMVVISGSVLLIPSQIIAQENTPQLSQEDRCYASGALTNNCEPLEGTSGPYPNPATAMAQNRDFSFMECQAAVDANENPDCVLGEDGNEPANAVIIGDSHATAWLPVIDQLGKDHGLRVKTFTRSGCTPIDLERSSTGNAGKEADICTEHVKDAFKFVEEHDEIKYVFFAASPVDRPYVGPDGERDEKHGVNRLVQVFKELEASGKEVVAFEEVPRFGEKVPVCLEAHPDDPMACTRSVKNAFKTNSFITEAMKQNPAGVASVSVRDQICDDEKCYPVLGTVMTYRDGSHLTELFVESLYPVVEQRLRDQGVFPATKD